MKRLLKIVRILILLVLTYGLINNSFNFIKGRILLSKFIEKVDLQLKDDALGPRSYEGVIQIRDIVRNQIKESPPFSRFNLDRRPLLGYTLKDILESKEGQCGEATRLPDFTLKNVHYKSNNRKP